jgi:hypothetical protein
MTEPKKVDRIYVGRKDLKDFRDLVKEKHSPFADSQNKDIFLAAMIVGYHESGRIPLGSKEGFFREEYLSDEERALIRAVAVSTEGDLNVLLDEQKVYSIAEEYATGGIALLKAKVFSGEYGSYAKKLESELLRTFRKTAEKAPKRQTFEELVELSVSELIKNGETDSVEFKSSFIWDYKRKQPNKLISRIIARTVSCFMNSNGGIILVGVSNDKKILGLDKDLAQLNNSLDNLELHFTNIINKYLGKISRPQVSVKFETINKKTAAVIQVRKSPRPVYLQYEGKTEFFIRSGNSCQPLDISEAHLYIKDHWPDLR